MVLINIKPLSVNEAWKGRRFKTDAYKAYETTLLWMLPASFKVPDSPCLELFLEFGFSNKSSDFDNPVKPFVDILQKKYNFNDSRIYKTTIVKTIRSKGGEYIRFELKGME
ncbi:MAG: hypothetical protein GY928_25815 [Colwellia sp.]|nr:hypothetical protein [Colwellia sp.]